MKWRIGLVAAVAGMLLASGLASAVEREGPWIVNDLEAARKEALTASPPRPIFVVFR